MILHNKIIIKVSILIMPRFICDGCGKEFARKENLDYHIKNNSCKENPFACENCGRKFTTKTSMIRHMKTTCAVKKEQDAKKDEILERLIQMEEQLKVEKKEREQEAEKVKIALKEKDKQVKKLKTDIKQLTNENRKLRTVSKNINSNNTTTTTTNSNNVQNINNGTVNNITLVGYGKEDISKLDRSEILEILRTGYNSTVTLTEAVHFNPKYPE